MITWPSELPVLTSGGLLMRTWATGDEQRVFEIAVSLHHINEFDHWAEIGYWTSPTVRGQGLTSLAVRLVTDFAFSIGFRRVHAVVDPDNIASQKVLDKADFTYESTMTHGITRRNGTQVDAMLYAAFPAS